MTEALPIGNGPMGAMLFGGTEIERIQFNEISLWIGDRMAVEGRVLGETQAEEEQNLGAYQAFGDIFIQLGHDFASHPDGVIVIHLTANKPAAYTGHIQLADIHVALFFERFNPTGKDRFSVDQRAW